MVMARVHSPCYLYVVMRQKCPELFHMALYIKDKALNAPFKQNWADTMYANQCFISFVARSIKCSTYTQACEIRPTWLNHRQINRQSIISACTALTIS